MRKILLFIDLAIQIIFCLSFGSLILNYFKINPIGYAWGIIFTYLFLGFSVWEFFISPIIFGFTRLAVRFMLIRKTCFVVTLCLLFLLFCSFKYHVYLFLSLLSPILAIQFAISIIYLATTLLDLLKENGFK